MASLPIKGWLKAFEELLELKPGELIIPEYFKVMGAIGAAMMASERHSDTPIKLQVATEVLRRYLAKKANEAEVGHLRRLINNGDGSTPLDECPVFENNKRVRCIWGLMLAL